MAVGAFALVLLAVGRFGRWSGWLAVNHGIFLVLEQRIGDAEDWLLRAEEIHPDYPPAAEARRAVQLIRHGRADRVPGSSIVASTPSAALLDALEDYLSGDVAVSRSLPTDEVLVTGAAAHIFVSRDQAAWLAWALRARAGNRWDELLGLGAFPGRAGDASPASAAATILRLRAAAALGDWSLASSLLAGALPRAESWHSDLGPAAALILLHEGHDDELTYCLKRWDQLPLDQTALQQAREVIAQGARYQPPDQRAAWEAGITARLLAAGGRHQTARECIDRFSQEAAVGIGRLPQTSSQLFAEHVGAGATWQDALEAVSGRDGSRLPASLQEIQPGMVRAIPAEAATLLPDGSLRQNRGGRLLLEAAGAPDLRQAQAVELLLVASGELAEDEGPALMLTLNGQPRGIIYVSSPRPQLLRRHLVAPPEGIREIALIYINNTISRPDAAARGEDRNLICHALIVRPTVR